MSNQNSHLFFSPTFASSGSDGVNVVGFWPQIQIPRDRDDEDTTHPPPLKKLRYSDDTPPNPQQQFFFPPSNHPHNLHHHLNPPHPNNKTTLFFKTRLCNQFKQGTCFYGSHCNFAHGTQELRSAPPNWQQIIAKQHSFATSSEQQKHTMSVDAQTQNYNFHHGDDELKKFGGNAVSRNADRGAGPARLHSNPAEERAPPSKPEPIPKPQPEQQKAFPRWKVPKKINGIYGDWIN